MQKEVGLARIIRAEQTIEDPDKNLTKQEHREDRSYRKTFEFGSPAWAALRGKSPDDIEQDFKDFLRMAFSPYNRQKLLSAGGGIKMTEGYSSDLTVLFTNVLGALGAFTRCQHLLTERQRAICYAHYWEDKTYKQIGYEIGYSEILVKQEMKTAIKRMLVPVMQIIFWPDN